MTNLVLAILDEAIYNVVTRNPSSHKKIVWIYFEQGKICSYLNSDEPVWVGLKTKFLKDYSRNRIVFKPKSALLPHSYHVPKGYSGVEVNPEDRLSLKHDHVKLKVSEKGRIILPKSKCDFKLDFDFKPICPPLPPVSVPCPVRVNNTVFVDAQYGNDLTAQAENPCRPAKTIQRGINIAEALVNKEDLANLVQVNPGVYPENLTVNGRVSIRGAGQNLTRIEGNILVQNQGGVAYERFSLKSSDPRAMVINYVEGQIEDTAINDLRILHNPIGEIIPEPSGLFISSSSQTFDEFRQIIENTSIESDLSGLENEGQYDQIRNENVIIQLNNYAPNIRGNANWSHSFIRAFDSEINNRGGIFNLRIVDPQRTNNLFWMTNSVPGLKHIQQDARINVQYLGDPSESEVVIWRTDSEDEQIRSNMQITNATCDFETVPQENLTLAESNGENALINILSCSFVGLDRHVPLLGGTHPENIKYNVNSSEGSTVNLAGSYSDIKTYTELFADSPSGTAGPNHNTILMDKEGAFLNLPLNLDSILNGKNIIAKNTSSEVVYVDNTNLGFPVPLIPGETLTVQAKEIPITSRGKNNSTQVEWNLLSSPSTLAQQSFSSPGTYNVTPPSPPPGYATSANFVVNGAPGGIGGNGVQAVTGTLVSADLILESGDMLTVVVGGSGSNGGSGGKGGAGGFNGGGNGGDATTTSSSASTTGGGGGGGASDIRLNGNGLENRIIVGAGGGGNGGNDNKDGKGRGGAGGGVGGNGTDGTDGNNSGSGGGGGTQNAGGSGGKGSQDKDDGVDGASGVGGAGGSITSTEENVSAGGGGGGGYYGGGGGGAARRVFITVPQGGGGGGGSSFAGLDPTLYPGRQLTNVLSQPGDGSGFAVINYCFILT